MEDEKSKNIVSNSTWLDAPGGKIYITTHFISDSTNSQKSESIDNQGGVSEFFKPEDFPEFKPNISDAGLKINPLVVWQGVTLQISPGMIRQYMAEVANAKLGNKSESKDNLTQRQCITCGKPSYWSCDCSERDGLE